VPGAERLAVAKGHNSLGPFELDDRPGTESFVLLIGSRPVDDDDLRQWIGAAAESIAAGPRQHQEALAAVLAALRTHASITVGFCTFEHLAR